MTTKKRPSFKAFMKKALQDPEFKKEYEALKPEFDLLAKFIQARKKARISQIELAKKLKIQQPTIARLEGGGYAKTSFAQLSKVADALGCSLKISLQAKK